MRKSSRLFFMWGYAYGGLGAVCLFFDLASDAYIAGFAVMATIFAVGGEILKEMGR